MENHPSVAIAMLIAGLRYPIATTAHGLAWMLFRIIYAVSNNLKSSVVAWIRPNALGYDTDPI